MFQLHQCYRVTVALGGVAFPKTKPSGMVGDGRPAAAQNVGLSLPAVPNSTAP